MPRCPENERLIALALQALTRITDLNNASIDAMRAEDPVRLQELDEELEQVFGEKERAMGAWRQHKNEHGC